MTSGGHQCVEQILIITHSMVEAALTCFPSVELFELHHYVILHGKLPVGVLIILPLTTYCVLCISNIHPKLVAHGRYAEACGPTDPISAPSLESLFPTGFSFQLVCDK